MSMISTRCHPMSINRFFIDMSGVYVDFIDRLVTNVEKTQNFDEWASIRLEMETS